MYAMIYELIVAASHQSMGRGSEILVRKCASAGIHDIQLFSAAGKSGFYGERGFEDRLIDAPGMRLFKR